MLRTDRVIGLVWIGAEFVLSRFTSHFSWLLGGGADWFLTGIPKRMLLCTFLMLLSHAAIPAIYTEVEIAV